MSIVYCTTCIGFAVSWRDVSEPRTALAKVERESAQALFGLHLASAHVEAEAPPLVPDCPACQQFDSYTVAHGEDSVAPGDVWRPQVSSCASTCSGISSHRCLVPPDGYPDQSVFDKTVKIH